MSVCTGLNQIFCINHEVEQTPPVSDQTIFLIYLRPKKDSYMFSVGEFFIILFILFLYKLLMSS